ncbi:hypothetical protein D910_10268 [Dendroctonus ponderosae]
MENFTTAEEQDNVIIQNSIRFLHTLTNLRKLNVPTLQSLYRTKCRLMELRRHVSMPVQKPYQRCEKCLMKFSEADTGFEITPSKPSPFAKKIIEKVRKNQPLTDFQKAYYKKLLKRFPKGFQEQNKLTLTCNFCKNGTIVAMNKPKRQRQVKAKKPPAKTKKKSKKKDRFCGLNQSVVLLSSAKKKPESENANTKNTQETSLHPIQPFEATTGTMTNSRMLQTPLKSIRNKHAIRLAKKKENVVTEVLLPVISKAKAKQNKKRLNDLSRLVQNRGKSKSKQTPRLKDFLASL